MRSTGLCVVLLVIVLAIALVCQSALSTSFAAWQDVIHVTKAGSPDPDGSLSKPYHVVEAGILRTLGSPASAVEIAAGQYYETFTADTPCTLKASGGTVTIGKMDYQASTTLEIITLNTHLFGDVVGPSWQDYARADDIADFFGGSNPLPDVVGFQEIWDEDLFFGGDGANGIRPRSGYPYGDHGDLVSICPNLICTVNSGLALMSKRPLASFQQVAWDECSSFEECSAAKGWLQAMIVKDGFSIALFNLHTEADEDPFSKMARQDQFIQLKTALLLYRAVHPDHVVFVMGDFNVYGEETEYNDVVVPQIGSPTGGRDADRNSPGFVFDSSKQWTYGNSNPLKMKWDAGAKCGRLDYIFYFASLDGSVEVIPTSVEVLPFTGRTLTEDGLTTNQSSDHWSVHGQFQLIRP